MESALLIFFLTVSDIVGKRNKKKKFKCEVNSILGIFVNIKIQLQLVLYY